MIDAEMSRLLTHHLQVRCEFKTDPDTCKRCLNGGHVCVIPGRKKRRPPP